jgi:diguanylate cyclase (GGDEF)-like protein/PAS domain S-box-containing protein
MQIFNSLPVPAVQLDPQTKIVHANPLANELFEWERGPIEQPSFTNYLNPHCTPDFHVFFEKIQPEVPSLFSTILTLDGEKSKRVTIKSTAMENGNKLFLINQQDVWNSGCGEGCHRSAVLEAQYKRNPGGILVVNSRMEMISFNDEFVKMWGIPEHIQQSKDEEASLQCVLGNLADPEEFIQKVNLLYENRELISTDEVELKDGRIFYRHTYPIHRSGLYLGRVWYFLDVTPLKQARYQVERQQIFQEAILENIQDGIIACNAAGKIDLMNRASRNLFGEKTTPIGEDISDLSSINDGRMFSTRVLLDPVKRAMQGEVIENEETLFPTRSGKWHALRVNGQSMKDGNNKNLGAVISLHDITDINEAKEQLKFMAYHDALTGLPNRRLFHDLLLQNMKQAVRNQQKVGVLFLDLDNFKSVNDLYGHDIGDKLLKDVARSLQGCLRDSDLLCRWGGDEFVIGLLENHGADEILKVAEKICATVLRCITEEECNFSVSVTIGIAISPDHGQDPDRLIRNADIAMYRAKRKGKNRCELFFKDDIKQPLPKAAS